MRIFTSLSILAIGLSVAGCGDNHGANDATGQSASPQGGQSTQGGQSSGGGGPFHGASDTTPEHTGTRDGGSGPGSSLGADSGASMTSTSPAPASEPLTDGQILEVVRTASTVEIEQAKIAQSKARTATVKAFAAMMVKDHGAANAKTEALAKKGSHEAKPSTLSTTLALDAKQATSEMSSLTGGAFDRAYVDAQVKEHQAVLDAIETKLGPAAEAPEVKTLLDSVRSRVAHHLTEAKSMQAKLSKATTTSTR